MKQKLCWYTGPKVTLPVRSRINLRRHYGFMSGTVDKQTGKPCNIILVDVCDIDTRPDEFKPLTYKEAAEEVEPDVLEFLVDSGQIPAPKTSRKSKKTAQDSGLSDAPVSNPNDASPVEKIVPETKSKDLMSSQPPKRRRRTTKKVEGDK